MFSRAHFTRSLCLMFFSGGFLAVLAVAAASGPVNEKRSREKDAIAFVGLACCAGLLISAWRLMRNNDRERLIDEQGKRYPWITGEYLNGLLDQINAEKCSNGSQSPDQGAEGT